LNKGEKMNITLKSLTDKGQERRDYRDIIEIHINGKYEFGVHDGEPEDNNLSRNFNDCWGIPHLMREAYKAGKNGDVFIFEKVELDDIE